MSHRQSPTRANLNRDRQAARRDRDAARRRARQTKAVMTGAISVVR
ncbi:hypothetical protein [Agromyces larvae]|uniref:Uncharacterized protein n=1 Tax=Agromyces larvae TaxID=2929802 RepID=A0ABY4C3A6_9MICO|nr:hypothetical protein [Agromyces larvae]UOE45951.1 hypothetical protein MTO99_09480 [Agromyces larvae]